MTAETPTKDPRRSARTAPRNESNGARSAGPHTSPLPTETESAEPARTKWTSSAFKNPDVIGAVLVIGLLITTAVLWYYNNPAAKWTVFAMLICATIGRINPKDADDV